MNMSIVPGSLSAIAKQNGKSISESFLNCDAIVIIDTSGSMSSNDSTVGRSRYDVACENLSRLQASLPGKIALISFSDNPMFCPSGIPTNLGCGTEMDKALSFVKVADVPGIKFILISDGVPSDQNRTLAIAKTFKNHIDTIFIGPEDDHEGGRKFLEKLSAATGGLSVTADRAKELASSIQTLMLKG